MLEAWCTWETLLILLAYASSTPVPQTKSLVSDDEDLSTSGLAHRIGNALGVRIIEIPIPMGALEFIFQLVGKKHYGARLFGNLRIDISKNKQVLNWKPKYTVQEGFDHSFRD